MKFTHTARRFGASILSAAMLALPLSAAAADGGLTPYAQMPAGIYGADKTHTSLTWKVSHVGLSNYTARFKDVNADLKYDPSDVTKSTLVATVNPASIETDYGVQNGRDFNKELKEDKWFNVAKFPEIKFVSTSIEKTGDTTALIHGNLTLLGVTKPLTLNATFNGAFASQPFSKKPTLGFSASGVVKRSDWGLSTYAPMIGEEVTIQIETELAKKDVLSK